MNFITLSERELKIVDGLRGIQDMRVYEIGYPKTSVFMLFVLVKSQNQYSALTSSRDAVKEFKTFQTLYHLARKNCPNYIADRIEQDRHVFDFHALTRESKDKKFDPATEDTAV